MRLADVLQYTGRAYLDCPLPAPNERGRRIVLIGTEGRLFRCSAHDWLPRDDEDMNELDAEDLWASRETSASAFKFLSSPEEIEQFFGNETDWESGAPFDATPFGS